MTLTAADIFPATNRIISRRRLERVPGGGYAYVFVDESVRIELRYLRRERGQLYAEVDVQCSWAGARQHNGSLSCADLNLSNQSARKSLAKYCGERAQNTPESFDWAGAIDAACLETIRAERYGADPIVLDDADDTIEQDHNVFGLEIPADSTSLLIAHGGSLKSLILLFVLGMLATAGIKSLYVDWEWTAARHKARKRRLFGSDRIPGLFYLRCSSPLTVEVDRIRRFSEKHGIAFFGLDSVGLAADGKLSDDDVAIRFHRAANSLPGGKLAAAHVAKSSLTSEGSQTDPRAFGSVFFENLARQTWTVRKQSEDSPVTLGLFPGKQTEGERKPPIGWSFNFTSDGIQVQRADLTRVEGLAERLPIRARIEAALTRGPMTYSALADELSQKVDSIQRAVRRSPDKFKVLSGQPDGIQRIALKSMRVV